MAPRMVFIGWTALFEKLLTWALESTTGVNLDGELIESSTDLTSITDSSNNVTVEAIVYNMVPALNINFFSKISDPTISGTGQKLVCDTCGLPVDECCGDDENCSSCDGCPDAGDCCESCKKYAAALRAEESSVIALIRQNLAKWYYIMRMLALIAMLVLLIAIGIKMAITSVAEEKATCKRMLVDWVVGIIVLFGIHYLMLFIIIANENLVEVIHDTANSLNATRMQNLSLMTLSEASGEADYNNQELEIKVYEEIRTRAYDLKLSVGLPGMIMYMTLVYFAVRYTIVYLKRYLTIMVLTLMGPGIGLSYALQKVFYGKSQSYSTWLKEYTMNVIIQSIHAILYAVFISEALILALDSLAGMLIALVFINYTLKADKLFRRIFNMGEGQSLLGQTADAGDSENMKQPFNAVKSFFKADATRQVAKTLMHTPHAAVVKGIGKAGVAGIAGAATAIGAGVSASKEKIKDGLDTIADNMDRTIEHSEKRGQDSRLPIRLLKQIRDKTAYNFGKTKTDGEDLEKLRDEVLTAPENRKKAAQKKFDKAIKENTKKNTLRQPTVWQIGKTRFTRAIDVRNTFNISASQTFGQNAAALWRGVMGTSHVDPKTGKKVSDQNGIYNKLT